MRELFKSSLLVISARVLGIALQSAIVLLLARYLPASEMGVFALCYALLASARMLGPLGTDQTTMRMVARAIEDDSLDDTIHRALNGSILMVVAVNVTVAMLLGGIAVAAGRFFQDMPEAIWAIVYSAIAMPAFAVIGLLTLQLRGFGQQVWAQIPDSIILQLIYGGILVLLWQGGLLSLTSSLLALAIAAWLVAAIYVFSRLRLGVRRIVPDFATYRRLLTEAWDVMAALSVTALAFRAPLFIAASTLGPAAAAVLDIATRFGTLPSITTSSVMATFSPRFAALSEASRQAELSHALSMATVTAMAPALLILAALAAAGPLIIDTILPEIYQQAYVPMLIICGAQFVNSWLGPSTNLLVMVGRGDVVRNVSAVQLVVVVAGSVAASQTGLVGVALAMLAAQFVRDLGAAVWVARHMQIALPPLGLRRP